MDGQGWVLEDGKDRKKSTNGTWKSIQLQIPLEDNMIILADNHLLRAVIK